ncbi:uncharacterized [Tachysurus ichikawai]
MHLYNEAVSIDFSISDEEKDDDDGLLSQIINLWLLVVTNVTFHKRLLAQVKEIVGFGAFALPLRHRLSSSVQHDGRGDREGGMAPQTSPESLLSSQCVLRRLLTIGVALIHPTHPSSALHSSAAGQSSAAFWSFLRRVLGALLLAANMESGVSAMLEISSCSSQCCISAS